jgi:Lhr-like helicase
MENQTILDAAESGSLAWAHPLVRTWFLEKFGTPTEPQEQGWPYILENKSVLICAPTGSGKTLAAFLACIDRLVREAISGNLLDTTEVLYVSPLKALGNDIQRNLNVPLGEILGLAQQRGILDAVNSHRGANRRYARSRTPGHAEAPAAHPRNDSGVSLHFANSGKEPRVASHSKDGDRG